MQIKQGNNSLKIQSKRYIKKKKKSNYRKGIETLEIYKVRKQIRVRGKEKYREIKGKISQRLKNFETNFKTQRGKV